MFKLLLAALWRLKWMLYIGIKVFNLNTDGDRKAMNVMCLSATFLLVINSSSIRP